MKLNFKWTVKKGHYQTGEYLTINGVDMAEYSWNGTQSKDSHDKNKDYVGGTPLLLGQYFYDATRDGVRSKLEKAVNDWFELVLKQ